MVLAALNYLFHKKQAKYSQNYWSNQTSAISGALHLYERRLKSTADESVVLTQVKHMPLVISLSRHILDGKWTAGFLNGGKTTFRKEQTVFGWLEVKSFQNSEQRKVGAKKP